MTSFTFKKAERLKSTKVIGRLFKEGQSFGVYPLRLVWMKVDAPAAGFPVQFTPSVAKKNFKSAVARNRIKRKMREAWRLNKHRVYRALPTVPDQQLAFMVLYTAKEDLPYPQVAQAMRTLVQIFIKKNCRPATNPAPPQAPLS